MKIFSQLKQLILKLIVPFTKLAFTLFLLFFLFQIVSTNLILKKIPEVNPKFIFLAIITLLIQIILISIRWQLIGNLIKIKNNFRSSFFINLIGHFFNQTLPTSIGGDFIRVYLFSRKNSKLKQSIYYVVFDRIIGLFFLSVITLFTLIFLLSYKGLHNYFLIIFSKFLFVSLSFLLLLFVLFIRKEITFPLFINHSFVSLTQNFLKDFTLLFDIKLINFFILLLSVSAHSLIVLSLFFCALSFNIHLNMDQILLCFLILLLSSIPISFAGWGLREGLMIFILGIINTPLENSLIISLAFGAVQLLSAIPGLILFLNSPFNLLKLKSKVLLCN